MDADGFDRFARNVSAFGSRRGLLRVLAALPLVSLGAVVSDNAEAGARGRKARRHQADHQRRHAQTARRKNRREVDGEACIPTGQRCPSRKPRGKKGKKLGCDRCCQQLTVTDTDGRRVCACQPNGSACTTGTATACCSGFCNGTSCQATSCEPEPVAQTCAGRCGTVTNNCGTSVACDPCPCGESGQICCPGNVCDSADLVCSGGTCVPCGAVGAACCAGNTCTDSDSLCSGGTCVACGTVGAICCAGGICNGTSVLCNGTTCVACGGADQPCCSGTCGPDLTCRSDDMCIASRCVDPLENAGCAFGTAWTCDGSVIGPTPDLSTANLSGCNLTAITFENDFVLTQGANGPATNFAGANLTNAQFLSVSLAAANLAGANLTGALIEGAVTNADLTGANLSSAELRGGPGSNTKFNNATFASTSFANGGDYTGADFSGTNVTNGTNVTWEALSSITCPKGNPDGSLADEPYPGTCCGKWAGVTKEPLLGCPPPP